jgi:methionine-rich copper-binding protein CopC
MRRLLLTLAALALTSGQAFAHAQLVRADPRVGSSVAAAPTRLWLRFDEVVRTAGSGAELVAPDGRVTKLSLSQDPKDVRAVVAPLPAGLGPGRYEVRWRALSPDAHHTQGDFSFTVER